MIREVMGVIIDDSSGETIEDLVARPTALVPETRPLEGQQIRERQAMKMSIEPAPRKSGTMGLPGEGAAADAGTIGPPDAKITSRKIGLGGAILIGIGILTFIMLMGGRRT